MPNPSEEQDQPKLKASKPVPIPKPKLIRPYWYPIGACEDNPVRHLM